MDKAESLRIIRNYLARMPKTYRARNTNAMVVRDIILHGTRTAGQTSCMEYCQDIGIDPCGYTLKMEATQ